MKAVIVGLGGRGRHWVKEVSKHPDVEIVGYVEPVKAMQERAIKDLGVDANKIHDDLNAAIKADKPDFIVDITPPKIHEKIALTAFENGVHVLGEKPLSDDYKACLRIVEAAKKSGVKHMITQNYRFAGLPRTTKRLLDEGAIGACAQVDVSLYVPWADNPGSHYVTEPYMFLTDMGVHHFDMMRYTLDADPVSARAITWNLPWGWHKGDACQLILFKFSNGSVATHRGIGCTKGHVPAGHNGEWRYEGPDGTLTWEGFDLYLSKQHKADPKVREKVELDNVDANGQNPLLVEFVSAIKEDRQPECNSQDNIKSVQMVFAAVESAKKGGVEVKVSDL